MSKYVRENVCMAWQFKYDNTDEKHPLTSRSSENYLTIPDWILGAATNDIIRYNNKFGTLTCNEEKVNIGDYIVMYQDEHKGIYENEYRVYTKDDFEKLFKKIEESKIRW